MKFNEFKSKFKNPTYIIAKCDWWPSPLQPDKSFCIAKVISVGENKDIDYEIGFYFFGGHQHPFFSSATTGYIRNPILVDDLDFNIISEDRFNTFKLLYGSNET